MCVSDKLGKVRGINKTIISGGQDYENNYFRTGIRRTPRQDL